MLPATGIAQAPSQRSNSGASHIVVTNPNAVPNRINPNNASSASIPAFKTGTCAAKLPQKVPTIMKATNGRRDRDRADKTDMAATAVTEPTKAQEGAFQNRAPPLYART
ncbi:MAG: hypothetical protein Gyms2KO_29680 [Gymnodinialimonas sp.]